MLETPSEKHDGELKEELETLRRRLENLESDHAACMATLNSIYRRGFSRGLAAGLISLVVLVVVTAGLLYGQSAVDALFIDQKGNIGIGTKSPVANLDIQQANRTDAHPPSVMGLYVTGDFLPDRGVEFRHSNGSQGIGFGYNTIYATGGNGNQDLNLRSRGAGVVNVQSPLRANSLQIGNTVIGEGELQVLRKLAAGQLVVDLFNTTQREYLYAADCCAYDNDRRSVFTWRPKNRVNQGYWQLQYPR